jgi:signal recognition particle subunit SRP54
MDGSIGQAAYDQAIAFKGAVKVGSIVVTKLDGNSKGGGALSAVAATGCPIVFLGTGEHRENFEAFEARSFVSRLLGMGDLGGLMEKMKDIGMDQQEHLAAKMMSGDFTLRDFYDQMLNITKLGPLSQVMNMLPGGLGEMLGGAGGDKEASKRMKMFLCIMDSMTDAELDCLVPLSPQRMLRIAKGSGNHITTVELCLAEAEKMTKMMKGISKAMPTAAKKPGASERTQAQAMANMDPSIIAKMMPPQVLQQMGGPAGIQALMKQLASAPGGMEGMMKQMMGGGGMPGFPGMGGMPGFGGPPPTQKRK